MLEIDTASKTINLQEKSWD